MILVQIVLRIAGVIVCVNRAQELKRNAVGWGVFGFALPVIAMVCVYCMKPTGLGDR